MAKINKTVFRKLDKAERVYLELLASVNDGCFIDARVMLIAKTYQDLTLHLNKKELTKLRKSLTDL